MVTFSQRTRLVELLTHFLSHELIWEIPLPGEREPGYTSRVIRPQLAKFLNSMQHSGLTLRSDGGDRPFPVVLNDQHFYPDLAINDFNQREVALEVKILSPTAFSDPLAKAIGQSVAYRSGGYPHSIVLLVSKNGERVLKGSALENLGSILETMGVTLAVLAKQ